MSHRRTDHQALRGAKPACSRCAPAPSPHSQDSQSWTSSELKTLCLRPEGQPHPGGFNPQQLGTREFPGSSLLQKQKRKGRLHRALMKA